MMQRIRSKPERTVIGLMTGTSADGIDVALVRVADTGPSASLELVAFDTLRFSDTVRSRLLSAQGAGSCTARELVVLSSYLGELHAHAAAHICKKAGLALAAVDLIGCHGLTLYHQPSPEKLPGFSVNGTLQIGNAAILAERTGVTVVSDYRSRDMAAGGQGSPLMAYLDYILYNHRSRGRIALNIGGIASLTALEADAPFDEVQAFDTGPGNCLLDLAVRRFTGGKQTHDKDGLWARNGKVNQALVRKLMEHPYLKRPPPKSADREMFGPAMLDRVLKEGEGMAPADVIATLTEFTIQTIFTSVMEFLLQKSRYEEVIVGGGGARNPVIMEGLRRVFPKIHIALADDYRIPAMAKDAVLMAFLASETLMGTPGSCPSATGSRRPVVLGSITPGVDFFASEGAAES